jgi:hypothetical protein
LECPYSTADVGRTVELGSIHHRQNPGGIFDMKSAAEMTAATQDALIQFLLTGLGICATFAALVETELGLDEQGALEAFNRAVRGSDTIQQLVLKVQDATKRLEIEQRLNLLQARLADLEAAFD